MIYLIVRNEGANFGKPVNIKDIVACKRTLQEAQEEHKIMCIACADLKAYAIRGPYSDDTELEAFVMLHCGMDLISVDCLSNALDALGYAIDRKMSFNYFNTGNERHYKARSIYIIEKDTRLSFAHVEAKRDKNFKSLQALRFGTFCFSAGRIWEL